MGTLTKTFIVLNLVFSIAFVGVSATVLSQRKHWKDQFDNEAGKHEQTRTTLAEERQDFKDKLEELSKERDKVSALCDRRGDQLIDRDADLLEKKTQIERLRKEKDEALAQVDRLSQNVDRLATDLQNTRDDLEAVALRLEDATGNLEDRETTIVGLKSQLGALEFRYKELLHRFNIATEELHAYQQYEAVTAKLDPAVHLRAKRASAAGAKAQFPAEPIRATVRAVNSQRGLAVLNVGSENDPPVQKGYRFLIHRGREFIAAVEVVNVDKDMCAAEVVPPTEEGAIIQVGDQAVTEF